MDNLGALLAFVKRLCEKYGEDKTVYVATVGREGHYLTVIYGDRIYEDATYNLETGERIDGDDDD